MTHICISEKCKEGRLDGMCTFWFPLINMLWRMFINDMTMSQIAPQRSVSFVADQVAKWWSSASDGMAIPTAWPKPTHHGWDAEWGNQSRNAYRSWQLLQDCWKIFYDNLRKSLVGMNSTQTCYQSKGGYLRNALFTFFAWHIQ